MFLRPAQKSPSVDDRFADRLNDVLSELRQFSATSTTVSQQQTRVLERLATSVERLEIHHGSAMAELAKQNEFNRKLMTYLLTLIVLILAGVGVVNASSIAGALP